VLCCVVGCGDEWYAGAVLAYSSRPSSVLWSDLRTGWDVTSSALHSPSARFALCCGGVGSGVVYILSRRMVTGIGKIMRLSSAQPVLGTCGGLIGVYGTGAISAHAFHVITANTYNRVKKTGGAHERTSQTLVNIIIVIITMVITVIVDHLSLFLTCHLCS
jgi:hypothetical protein